MGTLAGHTALVTGAGSGIGRAIAIALAAEGVSVGLIGRRAAPLEETATAAHGAGHWVAPADLASESSIGELVAAVRRRTDRIHILVHSAGTYARGELAEASIAEFDAQLAANVRGPYLLTQLLLPLLIDGRGQIVFVNSSLATRAPAGVGQYAATKHALKAIADSLRDEVNGRGIRVLSVYPGRTATPQQEHIHELEGRPYRAETLVQPEDIARMVVGSLGLSSTAEVTDLWIRPFQKPPL
jgi:NAD(P)-dependent dehydrogenase (short-subunit alcohol dehydrogenase family)